MTIQRMLELLEIEHECILRNSHNACDRNCADCDLVQDDEELHEMYMGVIATLKEHEAMEQCLKTKCVICLHCDNCDVDENGLLKEQEAKCLTKEELSGLHEQQFVWIEGKSGSLYCLRIIGIIEWENDVTAIQFDTPTAYVEKSTELYGSQYKIWTAQPTAEQREAMEWND